MKMLRRLVHYLEKVFGFTEEVGALRDTRKSAQIPTASVWLSVFWMFVLRFRSFNALEQDLRLPKRWEKLAGTRRPSADTLGYGLCRFATEKLRAMLAHHNRTAWRNKAIQGRPGQKQRVIAVDGHELYSSTARCCPGCQIRNVEVKTAKGMKMVRQYYHRVVVAQWVGVNPPPILDLEPIQPGEGEVVAAGRLWERIAKDYDRLIDVVTADAIYLEAPFLKRVRLARKHFVVVMKQERRELYQDADQLRRLQLPQIFEEYGKTSRIWDLPGLTTFETYGRPVRVVWAEERTEKPKIIGGQREMVVEEKTWVWVTDLPAETASAQSIQRWGHDRWDLENRGFNELSTLWGMDHCFVHLPRAIEVILLTLALAFLLTYLFFERNLKLQARRHLSRLTLAARMVADLGPVELAPSG
jgi:hypothetical protein